jgi:hypothetical protein
LAASDATAANLPARYLQKTAAQVPRAAIETGLAVFIVGFV